MAETYDSLKIPPNSIEAEQAVLGGLLMKPAAFDELHLKPVDFYRQDHRLIFQAIEAQLADRQAVDVVTLSEYLRKINSLEEAGGLAYLATLAKDTPSAANIESYAAIVREKSQRRQLLAFATSVQETVFTDNSATPGELLTRFEGELFRIAERARTHKTAVTHVKPVLRQVVEEMHERSTMKEDELLGQSTGLSELDKMTEGLQGGDLVIVAGRPGMGKTVLAGCLERAFSAAGKAVMGVTMEMPTKQLVMRHVAALSGVSLDRVKKSMRMSEDDWVHVSSAIKPFMDTPLYYINETVTVADIRAHARRLHRELIQQGGTGLGLITVDYVQLMISGSTRDDNRVAALGDISRGLKQLALELDIPIILLSQLNRSLESRPNKRPVMSDLRESGALEQDADVIAFVYRDEVYFPDSPDKGQAEIIIGKHRNGPVGTVRVAAQLDKCRFVDLAPVDAYEGEW